MYTETNHPNIEDVPILRCYICNYLLSSSSSKDHIIPQKLFETGVHKRPWLPVHEQCNIAKSRDDRLFLKTLYLRSNHHEAAASKFNEFLTAAESERPLASPHAAPSTIRNFKLAYTLLGDAEVAGGAGQRKLRFSKATIEREKQYIQQMGRALFIRNVPLIDFRAEDSIVCQYKQLSETEKIGFEKDVRAAIGNSKYHFGQSWGNRVSYEASVDLGVVLIEFFGQVGYIVRGKWSTSYVEYKVPA